MQVEKYPLAYFSLVAGMEIRYTRGMEALPSPEDIEIMAVVAGMSMTEVCKRARLSPAVFHRWKASISSPSVKNLQTIIDVLRDAIDQKKAMI
jgi:hypothetical protein